MDIKQEKSELNKGTSEFSSRKENQLTGMKYEVYDPVSFSGLVSDDKFMNVVNVEPDSGTKPDPVTSMKEEELLLPIIYPVPKTEGTEETLDLATDRDGVTHQEEELCEN